MHHVQHLTSHVITCYLFTLATFSMAFLACCALSDAHMLGLGCRLDRPFCHSITAQALRSSQKHPFLDHTSL